MHYMHYIDKIINLCCFCSPFATGKLINILKLFVESIVNNNFPIQKGIYSGHKYLKKNKIADIAKNLYT